MSLDINRGNNNCIPISGIGYVVVPKDSSVAEYVQRCYRNHSISISGGYDSTYMHNVKVAEGVLNNIKFPDTYDTLGSPVVWIRDSFTNRAVVIGVLRAAGNSDNTQTGQQRLFQETANQIVEIFLDALNCRVNISAVGDENVPGEVVIKAASNTESGDIVKLISRDKITGECKTFEIEMSKNFEITLNNGDDIDLIKISGDENEFTVADHWNNKAIFNEQNVQILTNKFNVGEGNEQMVLGNTLVKLLGELIDAILNMTVLTHVGASGTPINAATFSDIKSKLETVLSKLSNTD